ncbi:glycosyltransferase [Sphingosinithalassobacter portus]|uniref:glycosyltransferase n=1 Tax=Stakelama portus TaxID=2676234 RepID=UPI000D6E3E1C|nr:glycosyltransferase [Sphingosinithalassobacter portus]
MLRILTLSTLFPDVSRPNFGVFVEQQTRAIAARDDLDIRVVAPVGLPPWPLARHRRYRPLQALPRREAWHGLDVFRPRFVNIPGTGGRFHPTMLVRALRPLVRNIRRDFPFDLIAAEFFYPDGPAAIALGREFGVPVSIKARGADIHHWGTAPATRDMVLAAGRAASGCLAVSNAMRDDMIALGMDGNRIERSLTGVDAARFHPRDRAGAKAALGISGPLVLSTGALIARKGHDIVIDAVARLPGVALRIAGEGPARAQLQAQIDALGVNGRIQLLGSVAHDVMPQWLAAADVMALASASEGLANAWVEALACGTPIVIPDIGGAREVMVPGAGALVERTADAFAVGITDIVDNPPATAAICAAAQPFSWQANAAHLSDFYHRLVAAG